MGLMSTLISCFNSETAIMGNINANCYYDDEEEIKSLKRNLSKKKLSRSRSVRSNYSSPYPYNRSLKSNGGSNVFLPRITNKSAILNRNKYRNDI